MSLSDAGTYRLDLVRISGAVVHRLLSYSRASRGSLFIASCLLLSAFLPCRCRAAYGAPGGRISGTIRDSTGAVIPNATVTATNLDTGVHQIVKANQVGAYSFPALAVGRYNIDINATATGFRPYRRTGIMVDVNSVLLVDATLALGAASDTVTVNEAALQAETSSTQLGNLLTTNSIAALPLNGRSYTDLLALQPSVLPITTITSQTVQGLGQSVFSPSGDLNPGVFSINGQRESANGYFVNGVDAEETGSMSAAIIPTLDSIAEFRILSNNQDAEYGKYAGGQINLITKSGTNQFHGNVFEFIRNTDFDARNFFSQDRGKFIQNQFGGTIGGPIFRQKLFFFSDYQGTRQIEGVDSGLIPVPSAQDVRGNLIDQAAALTGTVGGASFANQLSSQLGEPVYAGEPYYTPGCSSSAQCVLPNAIIPQSAWSAPASHLLQYIPAPNAGLTVFSTSAQNQILRDDKVGERLDANSRWGTIFGYYSFDDYTVNNPYPTAQGGANIPGFNGLNRGRAQLFAAGNTKTFGADAVNDLRLNYTRDANDLGAASGGLGVSLASQGFVTGAGSLGIVPGSTQGVESVVFNGGSLTIGTVPAQFDQINNDLGGSDGFSKTIGRHLVKVGAQFEYDQIDTHPYAFLNGSFNFNGTETGSAYADFLLGIASQYTQNQLRPFYERNKYVGIYAQDSWRLAPNFTVNYGLRWDRIEPWYEKYNNNITFIPGEQSIVFPSAPVGIVYPGDPGVARTAAPARNKSFGPRLGIAYVPGVSRGILERLLGRPGETSIRAGFGIFYSSIPGETLGLVSDNPPYGYTFQNSSNPLFATPFVDGDTGNVEGQRFPAHLAPLNASSSHPDSAIDFSQFEPIGATPGYKTTNTTPYAEQYMLSLQRQAGSKTLISLNYSGSVGRHLLVLEAANPGNPALCLSLPGCGPDGENNVYTSSGGQTIHGTRGPLGSAFGSVSYQATIANSSYNALEATVQHTSTRAQVFVSYTFSKSIDMGSNFGDQVDPYDPKLLRGLSSFDMRHNFSASYTFQLPIDVLAKRSNGWTRKWTISGIARFTAGVPITLMNPGDTSLIGTFGNGINNLTVDELDYIPGALHLNRNPRGGQHQYFDTSLFNLPADDPAIGNTISNTIGDSGRRFFSGPGIENFDMTMEKDLALGEERSLDVRLDGFNIFNHAQFYGPQAVDGNFSDSTFGQVVSAAAPRLLQLGAKVVF